MMALKILTLTWEAKERLQQLRDSLIPTLPENTTWLIRDNGSKDGTVEQVMSWGDPNVILYPHSNNLSNYSEGNNRLFEKSDAKSDDYILMLNNDVIFRDTVSLKNMIAILDKDPEVGIVGCKLNYQDRPHIIQHAGVLFHPSNVGTPFHFRAGKEEEPRDRQNRYYPMITGACLLTRASLFKEVGMLNEKLQWCWDDSDYCLRVANAGKKIVYCGQTNIVHSESASLKKNPVNKLFFDQNLRHFMSRWQIKIDKSLVNNYANPDFARYIGPDAN